MNSTSLIQRLHQHRIWANENLLASCQALTTAELMQQFEIGQGSIWRSVLHMYAAEFVWLAALLGEADAVAPGDLPNKLPGNQEGEFPITTFEELVKRWKVLSDRWNAYLITLTPESLDDIVQRKSSSSFAGQTLGSKRSDILLHVCTHAHYTTAQVINMLRHSNVKVLPEVMLITLARQEAKAGANKQDL